MCPLLSFLLLTTKQFNNSLEAFARICVNGFLFDPEVTLFGSSSLPLQSEPYTSTAGDVSASLPAGVTGTGIAVEVARQTSLNRGRSITQKIRRLQRSLLRPFALSRAPPAPELHSTTNGGRSNYPYQATPLDGGFSTAMFDNGHLKTNFNTNFIGQTQAPSHSQTHHRNTSLASQLANTAHRVHATIREPSEPTYLSKVMKSDANSLDTKHPDGDSLTLPFRLSISHLHSKTQRNVPYLRQSWTRIDFLAIVCFWIMFGLATAGFEHGNGGLHIGVFRAISVIRTARLLSVTSGTTVSFILWTNGREAGEAETSVIGKQCANMLFFKNSSKTIMHSLKTARPLLTSVAYFVIFAMVLFSYVFCFSIILKFFISLLPINKHHLGVG